jgi:Xaa-Pro aminopeptidase
MQDKLRIIERDRRIALFNRLMEEKGLDALVFTSTAQQTCQMAVKFLSDYTLTTRRNFAYMEKGKMPFLMVHTVGQEFHAKSLSWLPEENISAGGDRMPERIADFIKSLPVKNPRIGVYEASQIPVSIYELFKDTGAELVDITEELTVLRANKSEYEIELTKTASDISIGSFEWIVRNIKVGSTEWELIGGAEGYLRTYGCEDTLVLCRSEKPHSFISKPKNVKITEGGIFVYSCEAAGPGGYWTQIIRPIFMSRNTQPEALEILKVIKEAIAAGVEKMRVGNRICDVNAAIDKVVKKYNYSTGLWSGHGMGADLGDGVDIGNSNKMEIVPNMVLTFHPNIVSPTEGLLYSDTYRATDGEAENLTGKYTDSPFYEDLIKLV